MKQLNIQTSQKRTHCIDEETEIDVFYSFYLKLSFYIHLILNYNIKGKNSEFYIVYFIVKLVGQERFDKIRRYSWIVKLQKPNVETSF